MRREEPDVAESGEAAGSARLLPDAWQATSDVVRVEGGRFGEIGDDQARIHADDGRRVAARADDERAPVRVDEEYEGDWASAEPRTPSGERLPVRRQPVRLTDDYLEARRERPVGSRLDSAAKCSLGRRARVLAERISESANQFRLCRRRFQREPASLGQLWTEE
jgi:hypothetical protein